MRRLASGMDRERKALLGLWAFAILGCFLGLAALPSAGPHAGLAQQALDVVRVFSVAALAVVLILGPGVVWRASRPGRRLDLGFLPLLGLALLVGTGCLAWALAGEISPRVVCVFVLVPVLAWLSVGVLRARPGGLLDAEERRVLLVVGCVLGIAVARALWSLGPSDELYGGTISRTLEVGDRPDSRVSFGLVELVAHGASPFGALARGYFAPYNFSARGPLAGIASAPVVLLSGARPPTGYPDQPWVPFDPQGFMAYRLTMMTLASTAFLSLWTLTRRLGGERAARLALLLAATTPFLVHEVWFTWPKLLAASLVFLALVSLIDGRPLLAGLLAGIGYLCHPLALLSFPVLGLLALWPLLGARLRRPQVRQALLVLSGAAVCLVAWRLVNWSHYTQSDFLHYVTLAGRQKELADQIVRALGGHPAPVTLSAWVSDRLTSVANTLVPLRLFFFSAHDPSINGVIPSRGLFYVARSPAIVHFFFQYWTSLPFGVGIVFFPILLISLWRAARLWKWPFFVAVVVPFVGFAVYWGEADTGMLREGLQTWVLALFVFIALEQKHQGFAWLRSSPIRLLLALRSVEVLLVAVLPTLITRQRLYDQQFVLTDVLALLAMLVLGACLGISLWREHPPRLCETPPPPDRPSPDTVGLAR